MAISVGAGPWRGRRRLWLVAVLIAVASTAFGAYQGLAGGSAAAEAADEREAAIVESVGNGDVKRVVLTERAAQRLDVKTARVRGAVLEGKRQAVVPYAAILYDPTGETWVYTSPKPLVFVRHDVSVRRVQGDLAVLSRGPRLGAAVVTVGAPELWGVEYGGIEED